MTSNQQPLVYAAATDVGLVRGHNEDALLSCPELGLWAVADGMGGHRRGEVASALALQALRAACAGGAELSAAVHAANAAVRAAEARWAKPSYFDQSSGCSATVSGSTTTTASSLTHPHLSCRIGSEIIFDCFRANGFEPEKISSQIVEQHSGTDISLRTA